MFLMTHPVRFMCCLVIAARQPGSTLKLDSLVVGWVLLRYVVRLVSFFTVTYFVDRRLAARPSIRYTSATIITGQRDGFREKAGACSIDRASLNAPSFSDRQQNLGVLLALHGHTGPSCSRAELAANELSCPARTIDGMRISRSGIDLLFTEQTSRGLKEGYAYFLNELLT